MKDNKLLNNLPPSINDEKTLLPRRQRIPIDLTRFRHRSSGNKSVGCLLQVNKFLTSCGEASQYVQMALALRTPYACSPAIYGSSLIVAGRECIVVFGSVSVRHPILGVGAPSVLCCCSGA